TCFLYSKVYAHGGNPVNSPGHPSGTRKPPTRRSAVETAPREGRGGGRRLLLARHVHDDVELEQLRTRGDRLAVAAGVGGAGFAIAPGHEGLLVGPVGDHEVAVIAGGGAQQLETLEAGLAVDGTGAGGETALQLLAGALGDGNGVDLHDAHAREHSPT